MPIMDGIETVRVIRERERESGRHIPVIALTARMMKQEINEIVAAGFDAFVGKPLDFRELFRVLASLVPVAVVAPASLTESPRHPV